MNLTTALRHGLTLTALSLTSLTSTMAASEAELENSSWQLVEIRDLNASVYTPDEPADYLLRFRLNNRTEIKADCNTAGATWQVDEDAITFEGLVSTRKFCPSPSLYNRFIMHLTNVHSIDLEGDSLVLHAEPEGVALEFEPYIFVPGGN